jgi:PAS domain S-box-containing protein
MSLSSFIKNLFTGTQQNNVLLHQTFDHMLEGIQIHDFNWRYIYVNNALVGYSQYTKEELLGYTLMEKYPGIDKTDLFNVMENCMKTRTSKHFETEFIFPNGSKADFELSIQPVPEGLFILSINISERKKAEKELAEKENRFRALVENNYDIISLLDESFKVIYRSPSATRVMGYTFEEVKTLESIDNVHPEDKAYATTIMQQAKENPGKQIHATFRRQHKDGHYVWLEGVIINLLHDDHIKAFVTNFRDITEQKKIEEKLKTSEQYYRSIIEQADDMIYITDASLMNKFIDINPSGCQMLGYTKEEFLKLKPIDLIFEEDLSTNPIKLNQLKSGDAIRNERRLKRKDGTAVETESTGKLSADGNFIVFARDVSERKKVEREIKALNENLEKKVVERTIELEYIIAELKESDEKFQKVFRTNAAGIAIALTSNMHYIDANDAFIQMTGFSKEDLIGNSSQDLGMVVNIARREEILNEIKEHGAAKNFEMTLRHKSGREFIILASVETILLKGHWHSLSVIYDITDRKKAEEQLASVNKELEAFTYTVSHDLRAPLRAINGYAEMLHEDYAPLFNEEGNRLIQHITQNAIKMGNLIDDLLAFSKLGRQEVQKQQVNLNELLEEISINLKNHSTHKATIKSGTLHNVMADHSLLYQVLFNLVSNGVKYSAKRENPIVEVCSEEQNGNIIVSVKDNGAGFDMTYANKLFGVFQRLHSQEEFEGTGVGLAIVQRIIAKHTGKVWAEGKIDGGATFYFSLPIIHES